MGFSLDPRVYRGGCSAAIREVPVLVWRKPEAVREEGQEEGKEGGEASLQSRTAASTLTDPSPATVPACFVVCSFTLNPLLQL